MNNIERTELIKKDMFDRAHLFIEKFNDQIWNLSQVDKSNPRIPNIGITYNNKLVEIVNIFEKKGFYLSDSALIGLINSHLLNVLGKGAEAFGQYVEALTRDVKSSKDVENMIKDADSYLKVYLEIDKKILNFDIEKDISEALQYHIDYWRKKGENGGYDLYADCPDLVETYNRELHSLGYNIALFTAIQQSGTTDQVSENNQPSTPIQQDELIEINQIVSEAEQQIQYAKISETALNKIEELKLEFKDTPIIALALETQLINYLKELEIFSSQGDEQNYVLNCQKIENFNAIDEMVESIGKYVAFRNSFYDYNEFPAIKEELTLLGLERLIPEIKQDIISNKYQKYVEQQSKILQEQSQLTTPKK